jgi:hypothetical protein
MLLALAGFSLTLVEGVAAQGKRPRFIGPPAQERQTINERQRHQQRRIAQGVRSKEITRGEFARLEREQRQIRQLERRVRADGIVTNVERARVQRQQNQASRHINRAVNNDRDRN